MKVSVIIPTLNRIEDLKKTIDSVKNQVLAPYELIIVDQSDNNYIKDFFSSLNLPFNKRYEHINKKSLTTAKNHGVSVARGDIISFLDDDVILDDRYLLETVRTFKDSSVLGVGGVIKNTVEESFKTRLFLRIFNLVSLNAKLKRFSLSGVLGRYDYLIEPKEKYYGCEFLPGASSYRREVFDEFRFDEKLVKYAYREDADFSNRVYRKYPKGLVFNPRVRMLHLLSDKERIQNEEKTKMKYVYSFHIYLKHNPISFMFYWSIFVHFMHMTLVSIAKRNTDKLRMDWDCLRFAIENINKIKSGDIDFYKW